MKSYDVRCPCGAVATHRTGMALLGPVYGAGAYCAEHVPRAPIDRTPLAIYLLLEPGVFGNGELDERIAVLWPATGYDDWPRCPRCGDRVIGRACTCTRRSP